MFRRDQFWIGVALGFGAPVLAVGLYYLLKFYPSMRFGEFLRTLLTYKTLLTAIISVCLVANALLFTIYINRRKDLTARGIFAATCAYAVCSLIIKFFF